MGIESCCWLSTRKSMWLHWQAGRQVISDTGRRQAGTETSTQKNKQLQTNSSEQGDGMQTDWRTVKKQRSTGAMQTSGLKGSFVGVTHSSYWLWEGEGREDMWEKETLLWPPSVPAMIPRQKRKTSIISSRHVAECSFYFISSTVFAALQTEKISVN